MRVSFGNRVSIAAFGLILIALSYAAQGELVLLAMAWIYFVLKGPSETEAVVVESSGVNRNQIISNCNETLKTALVASRNTSMFAFEIDNVKDLLDVHDPDVVFDLHTALSSRLRATLGPTDTWGMIDHKTFVVLAGPERLIDMEAAIQFSRRLQQAMTSPFERDNTSIHPTVSVGFCLSSRIDMPKGETMLQGAKGALEDALQHGPSAIRSFSKRMQERMSERRDLIRQIAKAMENGEIRAFFQPQVSTRTGAITGFEALARWQHPERGLIPPVEFMPVLEQAGLMHKLGEVMVKDALAALCHWRERGISIPRVGVNFSTDELRDPNLVDRLGAEIDRHGLSADCLAIEVLETVVADESDDRIIRNLSGLAKLGCCIDLDDFGTGHASITNIRRFSVERIKIDRSFVTGICTDPEQEQMVSAIITMAERLGLDTLAEGIETQKDYDRLAHLGCGHLQGFGIARPMPMEETDRWISMYCGDQAGIPAVKLKAI